MRDTHVASIRLDFYYSSSHQGKLGASREYLLTYQRVEQLKEMVEPRGRSRPRVRSNFWQ